MIAESANKRHENSFLRGLSDTSAVLGGAVWRVSSSFKSIPDAINSIDEIPESNAQ